MTRQRRYWLFFVIIAVGLALSWGQTGRKTQQVLEDTPLTYLIAEKPCRPWRLPCAALAGDRALVLGPAETGLMLKQTGFALADRISVEAQMLDEDGGRQALTIVPVGGDTWRLPDIVRAAAVLRLRMIGSSTLSVADFPLDAQ